MPEPNGNKCKCAKTKKERGLTLKSSVMRKMVASGASLKGFTGAFTAS